MAESTLSIGAAAEAAGVTIKAIRYYEEIGLIPPTRRRANGGQGAGHRVFTDADIGRLRFIHHARALGLGLREVRDLVAIAEAQGCPGGRPEYRQLLSRHLGSINERIERLLSLRKTLESLMDTDRPDAAGGCRWQTCGCMDAPAAATKGKLAPKPRSGTAPSNKGGSHA